MLTSYTHYLSLQYLYFNRDGDLHQVMTVGEVDQALANRVRADQDLVNRGRAGHQVLQEIGAGEQTCAVLSSFHRCDSM